MKKFLIFVILSFCSFAEIFVKLDDISENNFIGKGVYTYSNGDKYEGDWFNDQSTGNGVYTYSNGSSYKGEFLEDKLNGKGIYKWFSGEVYEGDFVDNKRTGQGTFTWNTGTIYRGDFLNDAITGKGMKVYPDGETVDGFWDEGKYVGKTAKDISKQIVEKKSIIKYIPIKVRAKITVSIVNDNNESIGALPKDLVCDAD